MTFRVCLYGSVQGKGGLKRIPVTNNTVRSPEDTPGSSNNTWAKNVKNFTSRLNSNRMNVGHKGDSLPKGKKPFADIYMHATIIGKDSQNTLKYNKRRLTIKVAGVGGKIKIMRDKNAVSILFPNNVYSGRGGSTFFKNESRPKTLCAWAVRAHDEHTVYIIEHSILFENGCPEKPTNGMPPLRMRTRAHHLLHHLPLQQYESTNNNGNKTPWIDMFQIVFKKQGIPKEVPAGKKKHSLTKNAMTMPYNKVVKLAWPKNAPPRRSTSGMYNIIENKMRKTQIENFRKHLKTLQMLSNPGKTHEINGVNNANLDDLLGKEFPDFSSWARNTNNKKRKRSNQ
jgi:hypothetical protein